MYTRTITFSAPTLDTSWQKEGNRPAGAILFPALNRALKPENRPKRNRASRSRLRTALRELREALAKGDKQGAEQVYRQTVSALDKAIQKGVIHENTASRYKSRLSARVNALAK